MLVLFTVFVAETILFAQSDEEVKKRMMERQKVKYEKLLKAQKTLSKLSKIDVSGVILNDDGKPLDDVKLELNFSRSIGWKSKDYNRKIISNSKFTISQSGYTGLNLYFRKKGYFSEYRYYGTLKPSKYLKNHIFTKHDEKIVLRKIGKSAKLKNFEKLLEYDFGKKVIRFCNLSTVTYELSSLDDTIKAKKYIYLDLERDFDGNILMTKTKYRGMIPKTLIVKYVSDDKSDGFIVKGKQKDITYLTEAPVSGYDQKEIRTPYNQDIYFYYKNGDSYGKGAFLSPESRLGRSSVWLRLMQNIESDPKDKRNLRSIIK